MSVIYTKLQDIINTSESDTEIGYRVREYFESYNKKLSCVVECNDKYVSDYTSNQLEIQFDTPYNTK
jgi:hypothetical protein